tara:strand:+ start:69529 stop:69912 length:384 start_codon:yes stop_codon:yes gene_type:complete
VGTIDTILLSWLITGNALTGLKIGGTELVTKMILYYLHERAWFNLRVFKTNGAQVRHILKTFTWRFIGTMDTVILAWLISGNAEFGLSIGGLELITKMILYYLHERTWYKIKFGLESKNRTQPHADH